MVLGAVRGALQASTAASISSTASTARASASFDAAAPLTTLEPTKERSEHYASRSKSQATIKAYAAGWQDFLQFCQLCQLSALPASDQTVADYLA